MLQRVLRAERLKLRHSPVWLAFLLLPLFPAFFGTVNYVMNLALLKSSWYSLWTQHTLFSCYFFLPALFGVYCSYLWRLEHSGHNWNALMSAPVSPAAIYCGKLIAATCMTFLASAWTLALFVLCGKACGINEPVPWRELLLWSAGGFAGGAAVCAVQLWLSMLVRSFAVPVGVALIGGISGLAMTVKGYGMLNPYALLALGMKANNPKREVDYLALGLSCAVFLALFSALSIWHLRRRDIRTV